MSGHEDGLLLGIEIGGTKLQLGLGRGEGELIALERLAVDPAQGAQGLLDQIQRGHRTLLERHSLRSGRIVAVGVGFGGPVDVERGTVRASFQVPGWSEFPLADWIRRHLGVPAAVIQNDADTAGLAEARLGAGVGHSPLLYVTIGSGIGGALILNDQIYRGTGLGAGEIGHIEVPDANAPNRLRELEQVASGWGISRQARELALTRDPSWVVLKRAGNDPDAITARIVCQAAIDGDPAARDVLNRAREALANALRQAIALIAPRRIILGGGVSLVGETHWFEPIRKLVEASVFAPFRGTYDIVPAALGEEVVVHGALTLAHDLVKDELPWESPS